MFGVKEAHLLQTMGFVDNPGMITKMPVQNYKLSTVTGDYIMKINLMAMDSGEPHWVTPSDKHQDNKGMDSIVLCISRLL